MRVRSIIFVALLIVGVASTGCGRLLSSYYGPEAETTPATTLSGVVEEVKTTAIVAVTPAGEVNFELATVKVGDKKIISSVPVPWSVGEEATISYLGLPSKEISFEEAIVLLKPDNLYYTAVVPIVEGKLLADGIIDI